MNTAITSKESILQVCRNIVATKGLSALNMRGVADACHIALGTLYNYYSDKNDLVLATVESIWKDIFHMNQNCKMDYSFLEYIRYIFECVREGGGRYPDFFAAHAISIANSEKGKARQTMEDYFAHIKSAMTEVLRADNTIDKKIFSADLTETELIDFVFDNILLLFVQGKTDCTALVGVIRRVIGEKQDPCR